MNDHDPKGICLPMHVPLSRRLAPLALTLFTAWAASSVHASDAPQVTADATGAMTTATADSATTSVSFADFYRRPVGPRGLEPGARLLASAGNRVQLTGFIARGSEAAMPAEFAIIAPVPVALGDEDEGLADDLPAAIAYLHWIDPSVAESLAACRHAVRVTGRLEVGRQAEPDGRMSFVRLQADQAQCAP